MFVQEKRDDGRTMKCEDLDCKGFMNFDLFKGNFTTPANYHECTVCHTVRYYGQQYYAPER